jgi:hypothetical protein
MNAYVLVGIAALVVAGGIVYLIWSRKWMFGKAVQLGEAEKRAEQAEGASDAVSIANETERAIAEIMVKRHDTSATRKKLQAGEY